MREAFISNYENVLLCVMLSFQFSMFMYLYLDKNKTTMQLCNIVLNKIDDSNI